MLLILSQKRRMGSVRGTPRSFSMRPHTTSHAAIAAPLYIATVLDNVTVGCFLLLQEISPLPREKKNPDVDDLSALYPAQSAFVYPSSQIVVFDLYIML